MPGERVVTMEEMVETARPVVVRVIRRRFHGVSLRSSDDRRENDRAVECYQQAMLELCGKFRRVIDGADPPILSLPDYAARVAHNVTNEELRPPNWSRLSNRVRRVLSKETAFDIWEDPEHGRMAGYAGWRARQPSGSLSELRRTAATLRSNVVLGTQWENFGGTEWCSLLEHIFDAAGGPLRLNAVVLFLAEMLDVSPEVPRDDAGEDGEAATLKEPASPARPLEDQLVLREQLQDLWHCARQLRREWRLALLMNPPSVAEPSRHAGDAVTEGAGGRPRTSGRTTARGELEVLPAHGVASVQEIGAALELTDADYRILAGATGSPGDVGVAGGRAGFYALWRQLPLPDAVIGRLIGKTGMQVLALRRLAIRQVAGCMTERSQASGHLQRPTS